MSISTPALYETVLRRDRATGWWGLDTADPLVDDSGHGYTLTAVGAPANQATLLSRGDGGASGCRDFNGSSDGYYCLGTLYDPPEGPPPFHAKGSQVALASSVNADVLSPGGVKVGDCLLVGLVHPTATATISSAPAGWTQVGTTLNFGGGALAFYKKTAAQADTVPQVYRWVWSTTGATVIEMLVYRGWDVSVSGMIFDSGQQQTASGQFHSTTSESHPVQARRLAVWGGDFNDTITPNPAGAQVRVSAANGNVKLVVADYEAAAAGSGALTAQTGATTQLGAILLTFGSPNLVRYAGLDALVANLWASVIIRPDTISGVDTIFRKHQAYGLQLNAGTVEFVYRDGGGTDRTVAGPSVSAAATTHLEVWDDGTLIHFLKNGVETTTARVGAAGYASNAFRLTIGHYYNESTNSNWYDGRMDELFVAGVAPTSAQALTHYTAFNAGTFGTQLKQAASGMPRVKVEMAWGSKPTAESWSFTDETAKVRGALTATTSKRASESDRYEAGTMTWALENNDGRLSVRNTASPLYGKVKPRVVVRLGVQTATDAPVEDRFLGFTEGHPERRSPAADDVLAVFTASDVLRALSNDRIEGEPARPIELAGARLAAVLKQVSGLRYTLEAGQHLLDGAELEGTGRGEHAQNVAETDGGALYASGLGWVIYQDNHHRTKSERTVQLTFGDDPSDQYRLVRMEPELDEMHLFTGAAITPASGNVKTANTPGAVDDFFRNIKELNTLHAVDNDAQAMAEAFALIYSVARERVPEIQLAPRGAAAPATMLADVLKLRIGNRIKTMDRPPGVASPIAREHYIEAIVDTITPADYRVNIEGSPAELEGDYWLLGTSQLGQTTVLGW